MFSYSDSYIEDIDYIAEYLPDWSLLRNANILITGATGLIGSVLVDAIMLLNSRKKTNIRIIAVSRNINNLHARFANHLGNDLFLALQKDIAKPITIEEKIDNIIHLASNTHPLLYSTEPISTINTIVHGTANILDLAYKKSCDRVINASSVEIYGENKGAVYKFEEEDCGYINCNTLRAGYTESKRLAETLSQAYIREKNLDIINARFGRVYGAPVLNSDTKSTTQFIVSAKEGADIVIRSKGDQEYSYIYVVDAVTALLAMLLNGESGMAYNVAHDEVKTLNNFAETLAKLSGSKIVHKVADGPEREGYSRVQRALIDCHKLKAIGWNANYNLDKGLKCTLQILKEINAEGR
jgi:UDP-glucuronate decarboxylase